MAEASKKVVKEVKDLDDWLPITKSRNAKWWYSAFHNVTAMVGAGVLGLPYAMSQLGWYVILVFWLKDSMSDIRFRPQKQCIESNSRSDGINQMSRPFELIFAGKFAPYILALIRHIT
jgi:hypothetical protein